MNGGTTRGPQEPRGEGEWPALLAALLAGDLDASDMRVVRAFEDDPGRRDEWEQMRAIGDSLETEGEALRGALERETPGLDEAAVLGSFREITVSTPAGARPSASLTELDGGGGEEVHHGAGRRWWWVAAAAILLVGGGVLVRRAISPSSEPEPTPYLGADAALFITSPPPAFGTARWVRVGEVFFNLRVHRVRDGQADGPPLVDQAELETTTWTIDPEQIGAEIDELEWVLTTVNVDTGPGERSVWRQRRR